jgi:hypothetical protein
MPFRVTIAELATGIVCYPDGRRYSRTDGALHHPEFDSQAAAEAYCYELVSQRPELECWIRDAAGATLLRIPPLPGKRDAAGNAKLLFETPPD